MSTSIAPFGVSPSAIAIAALVVASLMAGVTEPLSLLLLGAGLLAAGVHLRRRRA